MGLLRIKDRRTGAGLQMMYPGSHTKVDTLFMQCRMALFTQ